MRQEGDLDLSFKYLILSVTYKALSSDGANEFLWGK